MNAGSSLMDRFPVPGEFAAHAAPAPGPPPPRGDDIPVFDPSTGVERRVDAAEATELFKTGAANLVHGTKLGIVDPDSGEVTEHEVNVHDPSTTERIAAALAKGGTLTGQRAAQHAEARREMGGVGGGLLAAGVGAADAATLGNASNAAGLFGEGAEEAVQAAEEEHPFAHGAGSLAGSFLMPGTKAAGTLGGLAEGALTREGMGLGGRMLAKGAGGAAMGAGFGGLQGLGDVLSEHALDQGLDTHPDLTGEAIVAGIGHGALAGAVLGGLAGSGMEAIATGAREGAKALAPKLDKLASSEMWRDINSSKAVTKQAMARVEGGTEALGETARSIGLDDPRLSVEAQLAKANEAKESAGKAIGDMYRRSGATGTARELVTQLDGLIDEAGAIAGNENTANALKQYRASLVDKFTANAPDVTAGMEEKEAALFNEEARLRTTGQTERADLLRLIRENKYGSKVPTHALDAPVPLSEMWNQRRGLNRLVYQETKALDPNLRVEMLRKFSGRFSSYLEETGEKAAASSGEAFAAPLKQLNRQYQHLSLIEDSLEEKVARQLTNRRFSLTDSIMQGGGSAGGTTALMAGHPLVAAAGFAAGSFNKLMREQGPRVGAFVLGRVGSLEGVAAHVQKMDRAIELAASDLAAREATHRLAAASSTGAYRTPHAERVASAKTEKESRDHYEQQAGTIRELADHPELAAGIGAHFDHLAESAPMSGKAAARAASAGVKYLAANLPPPIHLDPLRPEATTPPSLGEQQRWLRRQAAVDDPTVLFDQVRTLRLDPLTIDAVRAVYPAMFGRLVTAVHGQLAEHPEKFARRDRLALSTLLGHPVTPSASAKGIASRQQTYAAPAGGGHGMGSGSRSTAPAKEMSKSRATASESIAKGD